MKIKTIWVFFVLILSMSLTAFAAQSNKDAVSIDDIRLQTQELQNEVNHLREKLSNLEHQKQSSVCNHPKKSTCCRPHPQVCSNPCGSDHYDPNSPAGRSMMKWDSSATLETGLPNSRDDSIQQIWHLPPRYISFLAALGATVTTSPFLGLRSAFDASDLIINLPTMNEDLRFLKEHLELKKRLGQYHLVLPDRPIIELGGKIEGIVFAQEGYDDQPAKTDINLSSARLDVLVEASPAVHGFMAFNMDNSTFDLLNNSSLDIQLAGGISRISNSRVFVSRAFLTIGDLSRFPIYFTIGQMFVPFGRYASNMITSPLTAELGRTNERAILLGIYKCGVYGSVYAYRGDIDLDSTGVNQWGTNWGYEYKSGNTSFNVGVGYISNIAEASGFQITGAPVGFLGFGINSNTEILEHRVPAGDIHGEFSFGDFSIFSEYIWATRAFALNNLSFNGEGAKPSAANLEASYTFKVCNFPASIAAGVGETTGALALFIPKRSVMSVFNISIWKNTIESFEWRHDTNYPATDFAGGNNSDPVFVRSEGGSRNTYTLQVGVYF